jgi:hypothetical protein
LYLAFLAKYLSKVLTKISATGMVEAALAPLHIKGGSPCEYILTKCSIAKIQSSVYKARHFLGKAPQESENDNEYRKKWADKIINFMNNEIKWKYSNNFKFRGDLTKMVNGKVANCLDEVLLDEDIGGFVGMFLFDSVDDIKDNSDVMKDIFRNDENLEVGDSILMANWKNWSNEED